MQVIPVIDLLGGVVVRGVAGRRKEYRPIQSRIAKSPDPAAVAQAFVEQFGFDTVYVADLEAIMHGRCNSAAWGQIASAGLKLWLDAGVGDAGRAQQITREAARSDAEINLILGLESLAAESELTSIYAASHSAPPIFSLDLQQGRPLVGSFWQHLTPMEIARRVLAAGARDLIVLDLGDVGTGQGTNTLGLCRTLRLLPGLRRLTAGGGVRGVSDLIALRDAGCDAALVASALHDGLLTGADISEVH